MTTSSTFGASPLGYQGIDDNSVSVVLPAANRIPTSQDVQPVGYLWPYLGTSPATLYISQGAGNWGEVVTPSGNVDTLTGNSGGAITPNASNINIVGAATQLTSVGSGHTITFRFTSPTSFPGIVSTVGDIQGGGAVYATDDIISLGSNIKTQDGDLELATEGNKILIKTGANASIGVSSAMTGGTITIPTTAVTADSQIFVQPAGLGTVTAPQALYVSAQVAGVSFTVTSADPTDTSTVRWWIIN